jgi:hypothetical protein
MLGFMPGLLGVMLEFDNPSEAISMTAPVHFSHHPLKCRKRKRGREKGK